MFLEERQRKGTGVCYRMVKLDAGQKQLGLFNSMKRKEGKYSNLWEKCT